MNIKDSKDYLPFLISMTLFLVIIFVCFSLYLGWDEELKEEPSLEVNLPVIEWGKYAGLSKQYKNDTID